MMKEIRSLLIGMFFGGGLIVGLHLLHAQETVNDLSAPQVNSMSDLQVMLLAIESVPPAPASTAPKVGTFYSAQHIGTRTPWPPLPVNAYQLPVWNLGGGIWLLDDRNVDYDELQAEADLAAALSPSPMTPMSMMMSSLSTAYAYGNPVYLTSMAAVPSGFGTATASFSIAGGTNFVPYDILTSTNLSIPMSQWAWLGIGYTSNRYTFSGQPADGAFYMLAKPSKTMTVAWGEDGHTQSDVPWGLTNAVMVAGSYYQGLALLADGTVAPWGDNYYTSRPTNLTGVAMVACGFNHNVALMTNGTVTVWGFNLYGELNMPGNITNALVVSAQAYNSLVLCSNGTLVAWGDNTYGETNIPASLTNAVAIACGSSFNLAVRADGTVVAWGALTNVPAGLSNVVDVAAGWAHSVALKSDGTVTAWGDNSYGQTNVPADLTNAVAIAAGGYPNVSGYTMILKKDGTVVTLGKNKAATPLQGLNHVIAIGGGYDYGFAIRSGPPTPVITLAPVDQYQVAGGNVTFNAKGGGLYGVSYQWQSNSVNIAGATNATLTLTNVQASGVYNVVVTDKGGMGSITSSNANLNLVTPPVILSQSPSQTNLNFGVVYQTNLTLSVVASAPGMTNGFPLSYQWRVNGAKISGATLPSYNFNAVAPSTNQYSVVVSNVVGSVTSFVWQVTASYAINVTNDLLLIYNSSSVDSSNLCAYYLANRPMVGGANVLQIACDKGEFTTSNNCDAQIVAPVLNWLTNNPAKRPQYVILFYDIPTRLTNSFPYDSYGSVGYHLHILRPDWQPFVNYINAGNLADCKAYVDKLAVFGSNCSPGQLIISASAGNYGNTNFVLDNIRHGTGYGIIGLTEDNDYSGKGSSVSNAIDNLTTAGVSVGAIDYLDGLDTILTNTIPFTYVNPAHIANAMNVAGYVCWGGHSNWGTNLNDGNFPLDGNVQWSGNSGWWLIKTLESYNGERGIGSGQSNFEKWFSSSAFGGTGYSNTPVGACSNVEEPFLEGGTTVSAYFSWWSSGKNFAMCAWNARNTTYFQAIGDPFVTR